ncbi:MAG TPA: hypothetical protein PK156_11430 [Polyangium sp.]|nr:hypothetical protein [Polyangium sp.]
MAALDDDAAPALPVLGTFFGVACAESPTNSTKLTAVMAAKEIILSPMYDGYHSDLALSTKRQTKMCVAGETFRTEVKPLGDRSSEEFRRRFFTL